jgi:hypothetical protein
MTMMEYITSTVKTVPAVALIITNIAARKGISGISYCNFFIKDINLAKRVLATYINHFTVRFQEPTSSGDK